MSRRKKPEDETTEESKHRHLLEHIANFSSRSEKTSWNRKMDNMVKLLSKLPDIEDKIFEIMKNEKQPVLDEISELRRSMVFECIHPFEQLALHETHVVCKFCNRSFGIPNERTQT